MEDIIDKLKKERADRAKESSELLIKTINNDPIRIRDLNTFLFFSLKDLGIGAFYIEEKIIKAKQYFYLMARMIEYGIMHFNSRIFDYDIYNVCFAFLCDNVDYLRNTFADLAYKGDGKNYPDMDVMVQRGESCIYIHSMLQILKQDWEILARNVEIMERKVINKKKNELFSPDFEFYKAILNKDKVKAEEAINKLLETKNHKKRNDDYIINQLISMPALGYAKLAWLSGVEVEINNPLIPRFFLPIKPNESYDDVYDFLKS